MDVEKLLADGCDAGGVPGAVLAIAGADAVESFAVGLARTDEPTVMTTDHQFPAMSVTKSMTAALIADLVSDGRLSFSDEVADILPSARALSWAGATVDDLLACTAGLPFMHVADSGDGDDAVRRFGESLEAMPILCDPGERFSYSNASFAAAGCILEAVTGEVFDDLLHDRIFEPLGMRDTGTWYRGQPSRAVDQHWVNPDASIMTYRWWRDRGNSAAGAGTVFTTAADLASYGLAHIERWPELREARAEFPGPHARQWGRGWALYDWGAGVFGWDGSAPGGKTYLRVLPEHAAAVALVTNGSTGRRVYREAFPQLLEERFGVTMAPEDYELGEIGADEDPDLVVGHYTNGAGWCDVEATPDGSYRVTDGRGFSMKIRAAGGSRYVAKHFTDYPVVELGGDWLGYYCAAWKRTGETA